MTFAITINRATFELTRATCSSAARAGRCALTGQMDDPFGWTSRVRSEAGVEFWGLEFYGCVCRSACLVVSIVITSHPWGYTLQGNCVLPGRR